MVFSFSFSVLFFCHTPGLVVSLLKLLLGGWGGDRISWQQLLSSVSLLIPLSLLHSQNTFFPVAPKQGRHCRLPAYPETLPPFPPHALPHLTPPFPSHTGAPSPHDTCCTPPCLAVPACCAAFWLLHHADRRWMPAILNSSPSHPTCRCWIGFLPFLVCPSFAGWHEQAAWWWCSYSHAYLLHLLPHQDFPYYTFFCLGFPSFSTGPGLPFHPHAFPVPGHGSGFWILWLGFVFVRFSLVWFGFNNTIPSPFTAIPFTGADGPLDFSTGGARLWFALVALYAPTCPSFYAPHSSTFSAHAYTCLPFYRCTRFNFHIPYHHHLPLPRTHHPCRETFISTHLPLPLPPH